MSTNFNWTTDEGDWEKKVDPPFRPRPHKGRVYSWLIAITVLAIAALTVYWQVSQRVGEATAGVEADLSASFDVVQRALNLRDLELFRSILSGRDPAWTRAQRDLFSDGLLFDRPAMGLHWQGVSGPIDIVLADDLNAAELVTTHEYITGDERGISMTVKLELTQTYRTGSNRWLLAPPLTDFWGDWQTFDYDHVQIVYPARDADLVQRLGADLNEVLANLCQQVPELGCQSAPALNLRFSKSPEALLAVQSPANHFSANNAEMELPAPTLVGQPLDEAGYQALLRGYLRHVALVALSRWAGYDCCEHGLFLEALRDYLLANQSFPMLWPINAEVYDLILESPLTLQNGSIAWQVDLSSARADALRLSAYVTIDFLIESDIGARPGRLLQTLSIDQPFDDWLLGTVLDGQAPSPDQLAQSWYMYLFNNSSARERPAPIDYPDQDVLLICVNDFEETRTSLYLYQPETATVTSLDGIGDNAFAFPMPRDQGLVLHSLFVAEERLEYWLIWPDGSRTAVHPPPGMSDEMFYQNQANPAGDHIVWTHNPFDINPEGFSLLDLDACRGRASCTPVMSDGLPTWSPSGRHTLVTERGPSTNDIWLGDADGNRLEFVSNQAFGPFWMDDVRFGYLDVNGIVMFERVDGLGAFNFVTRLDQEALFSDLPPIRPSAMQARDVLLNPADPDSLLVHAIASPGNHNVLIRYELATGEKEIIYQHNEDWYSYGLSESGGYLTISHPNVISSFSYSSHTTAVVDLDDYAIDLYPNSDFVFAADSWSANDEWLVLLLNNHLQFMVPAYDYRTIQATEINGTCYAAFWVAQIGQP